MQGKPLQASCMAGKVVSKALCPVLQSPALPGLPGRPLYISVGCAEGRPCNAPQLPPLRSCFLIRIRLKYQRFFPCPQRGRRIKTVLSHVPALHLPLCGKSVSSMPPPRGCAVWKRQDRSPSGQALPRKGLHIACPPPNAESSGLPAGPIKSRRSSGRLRVPVLPPAPAKSAARRIAAFPVPGERSARRRRPPQDAVRRNKSTSSAKKFPVWLRSLADRQRFVPNRGFKLPLPRKISIGKNRSQRSG